MRLERTSYGHQTVEETDSAQRQVSVQVSAYSSAQCFTYFLAWLLIFTSAALLARRPDLFDNNIVLYFNSFANNFGVLDTVLFWMYKYYSLSGVIAIALLWGVWLSTDMLILKARILSAVAVAGIAGLVSRFLQHNLLSHSRPYHSAEISFVPPSVSTPWLLNTWNSFPSDTATVWGGLLIAVWIADRKSGLLLAPWIILVLMTRIYFGAHYITDLIGGVALSGMLIFMFQNPLAMNFLLMLQKRLLSYKRAFYATSFFISFQVATLFSDIKSMFSISFLKSFIGH